MRQVVLDTETTGLDPKTGHRIIEIGCIEIIDRLVSGANFHVYINPERDVDEGAFRVHGISTEFLADKPVFADILEPFLAFVEGSELIIHNAAFDTGFLDAEFKRLKLRKKISDFCAVTDTLTLAREKHPGQRNNLDALCKRYSVDNTDRTLHGALLDAEILARVYLAMTGGQTSLHFDGEEEFRVADTDFQVADAHAGTGLVLYANEEELFLHDAFLAFLEKKSGGKPVLDDWK